MQWLESEIHEFVESIWGSILELPVTPLEGSEPEAPKGGSIVGIVQITGEWTGAVALLTSDTLAHRAASIMFEIESDAVTEADLRDAIGELANMVGGSLKAVVPGPSALTLPTVAEGSDYTLEVPRTLRRTRVAFESVGEGVVVEVLEKDPDAPSRRSG